MLLPVLGVRFTTLGGVVNDKTPCSTSSVMVLRFESTSVTVSNLVPVKSMAVLDGVVTDVDAVELIGVPLNWLTGASLAPVTATVSVLVTVAPLASFTS